MIGEEKCRRSPQKFKVQEKLIVDANSPTKLQYFNGRRF